MEGNHTVYIIHLNVQCESCMVTLIIRFILNEVFPDSKCFVFVRVCEINKCVLPAVPNQVTNWTLIAKNDLGVKTLTDTADPTHRGNLF